jgi:UDP-N-acetylmuramoylalanine--D-glutamate ligase
VTKPERTNVLERNFAGMKVTVLGAARSGKAVARLLRSAGARVFMSERSRAGESERTFVEDLRIEAEFGGHSSRVLDAELIVVSPGVPSNIPVLVQARARGIAIYSEVEVASWFCHAPIVAITGTNGKTTTSSLVAHIFDTAGLDYVLAGNIGEAFSEFVSTVDETGTVILEVSSFQLDHVEQFKPKASVILNVTPDHLDRYDSFEEYAASKFAIMQNQQEGDAIVFNYDDALVRNTVSATLDEKAAAGFGFSQQAEPDSGAFVRDHDLVVRMEQSEDVLMATDDLALPGRHNLCNSLAAAMAARVMEVRVDAIRESLMTFEGVRHRLELVRELDNVRYINDSKATNVNAVWYALESYDARVILIAGGRDKGNDYSGIVDLVRDKVDGLVAIGESADRVLSELGHLTQKSSRADSMDEAVHQAQRIARPGDVVLLSPACASFDMFANFEERGDAFRRAVEELKP